MTDASVRVPEVSPKHDGREVDCELITRNGVNYYRQRTEQIGFTDHYGTSQYIAPNGELVAVPLYKLVGDSFSGATLDTNFWTEVLGIGGTVVLGGGEVTISTGTTANNAVEITSKDVARFSGLAPNKERIVIQLPVAGVANSIIHWGVLFSDNSNGASFRMNQTTFELTTLKDGVETVVANGSISKPFNGQYGASAFSPGVTSHFYEIIWQPRQVVWLADNKIIHTLNASVTPWTGTLHLPIHIGVVNINGSTTNVSVKSRLATCASFGIPQKQPKYAHIHGAGTFLLKNSPGNLHAIVVNSNTGTLITPYDALSAAAGTEIAQINPNQITSLGYGLLPYNTGLTVVTVGGTIDCTVIYD